MIDKLQNEKIRLRLDANLLGRIKRTRGKNTSDKIRRCLTSGLNNEALDNQDYSDILTGLFELKQELAPIGANLNQLAKYFNQGNEAGDIDNLDVLDELQPKFKNMMKLIKFMQQELKTR